MKTKATHILARAFAAMLIAIFSATMAASQYTTAGTVQAWAGYNNAFYTTNTSGDHIFANKQGGSAISGFWEEANEIAVAVDAYNWAVKNDSANLSSDVAEINTLCAGFTDHNGHSWSSDSFNDDLNWATIAFARAYLATNTASQLADAETNFATVWSRGQSPAGSGNGLSGLIQSQPPNSPTLDSPANFTFVIAGYLLYGITGTVSYKTDADNVYTWAMANLYQPTVSGGVCNGQPGLTCSKIYDGNSTSVGGSTGPSDYTYDYGIAIEAILREGNPTVAQNVANWLMFNSNNPNYPYIGTYTLNGTAYNVLPNYKQGGVNDADYNGIALRGIGYGLAQGTLSTTTLAWAQANVSAAWSIRNANNVSWNDWLTTTPATGLYSWDASPAMAGLFDIPNSSLAVTAPAAASTTQAVTLTATLTPITPGTTATGTVQFYSNNVAIGSPATISGHEATLSYTFSTAGTYNVTAAYSGDTDFYAATAQPASITVTAPGFSLTPTSTIYALISGATTGNTDAISITSENASTGTVTLACTVTNTSGTAAGGCALSPNAATLAAGGTSSSTLTITTTPGTSGTFNVAVTGTSGGSTVYATTIIVNLTASSFTMSAAPTSVRLAAGGSSSSTVTLTSVNGFNGMIALTCAATTGGGTAAGSCSVAPASVTLASGGTATATVTIDATAATSGELTTTISGSGTAAGATVASTASAGISATVVIPSFTLSTATNSLSFTSGATTGNTTVATVTSVNYFNSTVALTCSISTGTAAFQPTCAASPASVIPAANGTAVSTITINSTTAQAHNDAPMWPFGPATVLAFALILPLRRRRLVSLAALCLIAFSVASLVGCGGSSNTSSIPGTTRSSAGNYIVTVSGSGTSSGVANTASTTFGVTIN